MTPSRPRIAPAGETGEFARVWDEHRGRLLAAVERRLDPRLRRRVAAEDVLQSAYLDASRRWAAYRQQPPIAPFPWLYRITLDRLIAEYRRLPWAADGPSWEVPAGGDGGGVLAEVLADTGTGPLSAAHRQEAVARVRTALRALPPADRAVLVMRYYDGLSARDMGELLAPPGGRPVSETAVNVRLYRALRRLGEGWQRIGKETGDGHEQARGR